MTSATQTLADFLLACVAEDEAKAREIHPAAVRDPWIHPYCAAVHYEQARVLAECEAKRRIVARCERWIRDGAKYGDDQGAAQLGDETLRDLALPYADREGFREEWRP